MLYNVTDDNECVCYNDHVITSHNLQAVIESSIGGPGFNAYLLVYIRVVGTPARAPANQVVDGNQIETANYEEVDGQESTNEDGDDDDTDPNRQFIDETRDSAESTNTSVASPKGSTTTTVNQTNQTQHSGDHSASKRARAYTASSIPVHINSNIVEFNRT